MTALVLVTHEGLGIELVRIAGAITRRELPVVVVSVSVDDDPEDARRALERELARFAHDVPPLVFSDLPGATPHNVAAAAIAAVCPGAPLVSGLSLPMLLRALNHAGRPAAELAGLAAEGGRRAASVGQRDDH